MTHRIVVFFPTRVELAPHKCKAHEDYELYDLAHTLIHRIDAEAYIVQRYLEPSEPEDGEEPDVGHECVLIDDRMSGCEGGEVGDKEKIEEEFEIVGLLSELQGQIIICAVLEW